MYELLFDNNMNHVRERQIKAREFKVPVSSRYPTNKNFDLSSIQEYVLPTFGTQIEK